MRAGNLAFFLYFLLLSCSSLNRCSHLHQVWLIYHYQFWHDDHILINGNRLYIACRQWWGFIWGCGIKLNPKLSEQHWGMVLQSIMLSPDFTSTWWTEFKLPLTFKRPPQSELVWWRTAHGALHLCAHVDSWLDSLVMGMVVQRQVQTPGTWHDPMRQGDDSPRPWASPPT